MSLSNLAMQYMSLLDAGILYGLQLNYLELSIQDSTLKTYSHKTFSLS